MSAKARLQTINIDSQEVTTNANTTGEYSTIVDIQVPQGHRYSFPGDKPVGAFIPTHESATITATGGSTGTVNLTNNLTDSPNASNIPTSSSETAVSGRYDLVVWDDADDIQTGVASVSYEGNSFDYVNSDASSDDLEVYYLWDDSSSVQFRKYWPDEETYEVVGATTIAELHNASMMNRTEMVTFGEPFTLGEKYHLKMVVKTGVDLTNWNVYDANQGGGPGTMTTYSYADVSIPVRRIQTNA